MCVHGTKFNTSGINKVIFRTFLVAVVLLVGILHVVQAIFYHIHKI